MRVFEFGSGNSTLWWAARVASVVAVEHDATWAERVAEDAPSNAQVLQVTLEPDGDYCRTPQRTEEAYDVVVVDGRDRVRCAVNSLAALASDGVIIWDDSWRTRYEPGFRALAQQGFRRLDFTGLGPISPERGKTSVFYRHENCLGI
jgi:hypothetical protein